MLQIRRLKWRLLFIGVATLAVWLLSSTWDRDARAEYGDVVINNYSDEAGMRPVVFPHWFHRIRFRCKGLPRGLRLSVQGWRKRHQHVEDFRRRVLRRLSQFTDRMGRGELCPLSLRQAGHENTRTWQHNGTFGHTDRGPRGIRRCPLSAKRIGMDETRCVEPNRHCWESVAPLQWLAPAWAMP